MRAGKNGPVKRGNIEGTVSTVLCVLWLLCAPSNSSQVFENTFPVTFESYSAHHCLLSSAPGRILRTGRVYIGE